MAHTLTTCTFCDVGCRIYLETAGNKISGTYPSMSHPANCGRIYILGWHAHDVASTTDRMTQLLIKKENAFQSESWSELYDSLKNAARYLTNVLVLYSKKFQCLVQTFLSINAEVKDGT